jgi:hypothetical protein
MRQLLRPKKNRWNLLDSGFTPPNYLTVTVAEPQSVLPLASVATIL